MSRLAKPALFCDVDGTLAFWPECEILAVNARFGSTWLVPDVTAYPFRSMLPDRQAAWLDANWPVIAANAAPDTRAVRVLQKAAKAGISVTVATERDPALRDLTAAWLAFAGVPYGTLAVVGKGNKGPLLDPYGKGNPAVLIDDNPANATLARPGVEVWQPARPYNTGAGVTRFTDWRDVCKRLGLKK